MALKGTKEPYRMFTSRAEHRLLLREDNVWERLFPKALEWGLLSLERRKRIEKLLSRRARLKEKLFRVVTPRPEVQEQLKALGTMPLTKPQSLKEVLKRPEISLQDLSGFFPEEKDALFNEEAAAGVEASVKYEDYIAREEELIKVLEKTDRLSINRLNYEEIKGLSLEEKEKLSLIRPRTLGQARRISGVNPSAVQALFIHLKIQERRRKPLSPQ